jgi:hypothetical protein
MPFYHNNNHIDHKKSIKRLSGGTTKHVLTLKCGYVLCCSSLYLVYRMKVVGRQLMSLMEGQVLGYFISGIWIDKSLGNN